MLAETRVIGLAPVVYNEKGELVPQYWYYFPQIRPVLAKIKIWEEFDDPFLDGKIPYYIQTMDDLFFYRFLLAKCGRKAIFTTNPYRMTMIRYE